MKCDQVEKEKEENLKAIKVLTEKLESETIKADITQKKYEIAERDQRKSKTVIRCLQAELKLKKTHLNQADECNEKLIEVIQGNDDEIMKLRSQIFSQDKS